MTTKSLNGRALLYRIVAAPDRILYTAELARGIDLDPASTLRLLRTLARDGLIVDAPEEAETARAAHRPQRRYWNATEAGAQWVAQHPVNAPEAP